MCLNFQTLSEKLMYTFFGSWTRINYTNQWTRKKQVKFCFLVNFFHFFLSCNSLEVRGINEEKLLRGSQIRQMFMTKTSCDKSMKNEFENWLNGLYFHSPDQFENLLYLLMFYTSLKMIHYSYYLFINGVLDLNFSTHSDLKSE